MLAAATAAAVVVGAVGPVHSQEAVTGTGTSALSLVPAELAVQGLPAPLATTLGTLTASATNIDGALALLSLDGLRAAGQDAGAFSVSSTDGDRSGSETRQAGAGGVAAVVNLLDYAVSAGEGSATSRLAGLGAELTTPVGLGTALDAQQLLTRVSTTDAAGGAMVSLAGLELGLGDLLPADVLAALPLSVVLDLVNSLGLPLPADLAGQVADVEALPGKLQAATNAAKDLAVLHSQIAALLAGLPSTTAAQAAVTQAQQAVDQLLAQVPVLESQIAGLTTQITSLQSRISALPLGPLDPLFAGLTTQLNDLTGQRTTLQGQLATVTGQLASAQSALTTAQNALNQLLETIKAANPQLAVLLARLADLESLLNQLLAQVAALLDGLDLPGLLEDLLGLLDGAALLNLGDLTIDLATAADGAGSEGTATCTAGGLAVLGTAVPTPTCADVAGALDRVDAALGQALAGLPVVGSALPNVDVSGLAVTGSGSGAPVDGVSEAFARVSALTLDIDPLQLASVTDGLIGQLDGLTGQLTSALDGLDLAALDGLLGKLPILAAASGDEVNASAVALPVNLNGLLSDLRSSLDALPLGDALAGLDTLGLEAVLGAVDVTSTFTAAGSPTSPITPGTPGTPGAPDAPGNPAAPDAPGSPGQLPRTGAAMHLLAMAALAALAAGATTMGLSWSVANGLHRAPLRRKS